MAPGSAPEAGFRPGGRQIIPRPHDWSPGPGAPWEPGIAASFDDVLAAVPDHEGALLPAFPEARHSAVLVLLHDGDAGPEVLLTRRSWDLRHHRGEVSFPGGRMDPGETALDAALREAHEEVGLDPASVEVLGRLDDAWSGAGHHVVPIVGWVASPPRLVASPREVAEILLADVETLLRPESLSEHAFEHEGHRYVNPVLRWEGGDAYGLTADLLLEAMSWGRGTPAPGGANRLNDLENYRRRQQDPAYPHGKHPVASGARHETGDSK